MVGGDGGGGGFSGLRAGGAAGAAAARRGRRVDGPDSCARALSGHRASALSLPDVTIAAKPRPGLEDIVATSSAICYLDGDSGVLAYCGYDIHDLARHATFEEVCYLLRHHRLPTP